jgi:NADPH:quinone reductase-like Zn-dependent oxidoreductase
MPCLISRFCRKIGIDLYARIAIIAETHGYRVKDCGCERCTSRYSNKRRLHDESPGNPPLRSKEVRAPGPGEVRIKVAAAASNPTDILLREPGHPDQSLPNIPGMDAAATIESVDSDVSRLQVGEEVMAAVSVVAIPKGVSLAEASTFPMNGLTALYALELAGLNLRNVRVYE